MLNNSKIRVISGVLTAAISAFLLYMRQPLVVILALFFTISGVIEFNAAYRKAGNKPIVALSVALTAIIVPALTFYSDAVFKVAMWASYAVLFGFIVYYIASDYQFIDLIISLFGVCYVVTPIALIIKLASRSDNVMWLPFILAISTDIFAYLVGMRFGKRKLLERVSPKKTLEGAIGGVVGCMISTTLFGWLFLPQIEWYSLAAMAFFGSIASQVGDLTASTIKRNCAIKDFGNTIPGHGGVLDRLDSILFTAPVVFLYSWLFL